MCLNYVQESFEKYMKRHQEATRGAPQLTVASALTTFDLA